ncbi:hypothetical protein DFH07DRAFT_735346, partial [Mycena maculata]
SLPMPIPAQLCSVVVHPPTLIAAIPVDAVIPTCDDEDPPSWSMIARKRTDFPVPADPEKKVFCPRLTRRRTAFCSSERVTVEVLAPAFDKLEVTEGRSM